MGGLCTRQKGVYHRETCYSENKPGVGLKGLGREVFDLRVHARLRACLDLQEGMEDLARSVRRAVVFASSWDCLNNFLVCSINCRVLRSVSAALRNRASEFLI